MLYDILQCCVQVADFGLSRAGQHTTGHGIHNGNDTIGTVEYMGPEMYRGDGIGTSTDVYSFGIMMWELVTRKRPLVGFLATRGCEEHPQAMTLLPIWVAVDNTRPKLPSVEDDPGEAPYCPAEWIDLMQSCWKSKPRERPRFPAVLAELHQMQAAAQPPLKRPSPPPKKRSSPPPQVAPEVVEEKQMSRSGRTPRKLEPLANITELGKWDCFISYTQRNSVSEALAVHLHGELIRRGLRVWLDIKMDRRDEQAMKEGVQSSRCVLAIVSGAADNSSEDTAYFRREFCLKELRWALEADVFIQPVVAAEDKRKITEFFALIPDDLQHLKCINWEHVDRHDRDYFKLGVTKILTSSRVVEPMSLNSSESSDSSSIKDNDNNKNSSNSGGGSGGGGKRKTVLAALLWRPSQWGIVLLLLWLRLRGWFQETVRWWHRR